MNSRFAELIDSQSPDMIRLCIAAHSTMADKHEALEERVVSLEEWRDAFGKCTK
jgi:hypothetical protein